LQNWPLNDFPLLTSCKSIYEPLIYIYAPPSGAYWECNKDHKLLTIASGQKVVKARGYVAIKIEYYRSEEIFQYIGALFDNGVLRRWRFPAK
jgi:hypothetical protein